MSKPWIEMEPLGPQAAGDAGGDLQIGEAYSRRWYREMPRGNGWMVLTVTIYGEQDAGRKWVTTHLEFGRAVRVPEIIDSYLDPDGVEYLSEEVGTSVNDAPADEEWPTDEDIREELSRYPITIHDAWEGN